MSHYTIKIISLFFILFTIYGNNCFERDNENNDTYHWDVESYPNLTAKAGSKYCSGSKRNPPTAICDPDEVLQKYEANRLDELINSLNNRTKCFCDHCPPHVRGFNIKVALVKHISISRNYSMDMAIAKFASHTRRRWHYARNCDNDILIFAAVYDDKVNVSMGHKARHIVTNEISEKIIKETKGHFDNGNYYQGLESMIASYQDIGLQWNPQKESKSLSVGPIIGIVIGSILLLCIILIGIWCILKRNKRSLNGSFEYFGSWGNRQAKSKPPMTEVKMRPPIYKPVSTSEYTREESKDPSKGYFEKSGLKPKDPII